MIFLNLPRCVKILIAFLRWMQSSVVCPWNLCKWQCLLLSSQSFCVEALGYLIPASFKSTEAISTNIFSLGTTRVCTYQNNQWVVFLLWRVCLPSFSRRRVFPLYLIQNFAILRNSLIVLGWSSWTAFLIFFLGRRRFSISCFFVLSSARRTCTTSLLKHSRLSHKGSFFPYTIASRETTVFNFVFDVENFAINSWHNSSQDSMEILLRFL